MTTWIPSDTPVLEAVFVAVSPDAIDIRDVFTAGLTADDVYGLHRPLAYWELLDLAREMNL